MIYYIIPYCRDFIEHKDLLQYTQLHSPLSVYPYIDFDGEHWSISRSPFREDIVR